MSRTIETRRIVSLLALAMAALLVVLSALDAPDAHAKKGHHHRHPLNLVQCPTEANNVDCLGTSSGDRLVGRDDASDLIFGGEGNDVYDGKGGGDTWADSSATSNDAYLIPATEFSRPGDDGQLTVFDAGGSSDVLDLRAYRSTDFALSKLGDTSLFMDGPGARDIQIEQFLTTNSIDYLQVLRRHLHGEAD